MTTVVLLGGKRIGRRCLEVLLARREELGLDLIGVGPTPRAREMRDLAEANGLPMIEDLESAPECDLLISVQYHLILKARHLAKARKEAVNLHLAPLPEYRGCNQFSLAVLNDDRTFGVTLHRMDEGADSGDILFESRFPLESGLWVSDVVELANAKGEALFEASLPSLVAGDYTAIPQSTLVAERGTRLCLRKEIDAMKVVDLDWSADRIARTVRATSMPGFPPPYAVVDGVHLNLVAERGGQTVD